MLTALGGAALAHADRRVPAKAELAEIGQDGRSLLVRVLHNDGCAGDGQATAVESADRIAITPTQSIRDEEGLVCAQALHFSLVRVRLAKPVDARRITGLAPLRLSPPPLHDDTRHPLMPRVVGLARRDALAALQAAGIAARTTWLRGQGAHGEVVAQAPRVHAAVTGTDVVRLRIARGGR
jgi:hypothetical protein